jgi:hypothetical protein
MDTRKNRNAEPQCNLGSGIRRRDFLALSSAMVVAGAWNVRSEEGGSDRLTIPKQIMMNWQDDMQTTMTVTWRTDAALDPVRLRYRPEGTAGEYVDVAGVSETFELTSAWINSAELKGLAPGTRYEVLIPHETHPEIFSFATLPALPKRIEFVAGGDTHVQRLPGSRERRRALHAAAAAMDPHFVLVAGDLWYGHWNYEGWVDWFFDDWHDRMSTRDGRRLPLVPVEGNHDGLQYYWQDGVDPNDPKSNDPFFFNRFKLPGEQRYYTLRSGADLAIIVLNSDHSAPMAGEQTAWLEQALQDNQDARWIVVTSHLGPYPRKCKDQGREKWMRDHWVPLCEQYGVDLYIHGHDHDYKQTYPIRNGQIDEAHGITYLGGGAMAERLSTKTFDGEWYLREDELSYNFYRISLMGTGESAVLCCEPVLFPEDYPASPSREGKPFILGNPTEEQVLDFAAHSAAFDRLEKTVSAPVAGDLVLPTQWMESASIEWESSAPDLISTTGIVTSPSAGQAPQTITLTATVSVGTQSTQRAFHVGKSVC